MAGAEAEAPKNTVYKDVLADRYATPEMVAIWSPENKIVTERRYWIAALRAQQSLGLNIPDSTIDDYEAVVDEIDLESIRDREKRLHHDVVARIEEFNELAGHGIAHQGFTSRDLTENVEGLQMLESLRMIRDKNVAVASMIAVRAIEYADIAMVGRSHNVPAQLTTLGKRLATHGEEVLRGLGGLERAIDTFPLRGIKGPVGTQQDMLSLFDGDEAKVGVFEDTLAETLGFSKDQILGNVGQIYPRSIDSEMLGVLFNSSNGHANLALNIRLMAGLDTVTEGFGEGQVGSSAMPHKMNPKSSERINSFRAAILGFKAMTDQLAGSQWNEGDVSDSMVRRIALPGAAFASDGLNETTLSVLRDFNAFPVVMDKEIEKYAPFVATTKILSALVKAGEEREAMHAIIKDHAVATAKDMRYSDNGTPLYNRLANDPRIPLDASQIEAIVGSPLELVGMAQEQARSYAKKIDELVEKYPEAASYRGQDVL